MDVAYGPFIERFQIVFSEVYKNDITNGRPKLAAYIEVYLCVNFILTYDTAGGNGNLMVHFEMTHIGS